MEKKNNLNPGDVISVDNMLYIVIKDYGSLGLVKEYKKYGTIINNFDWTDKDIKIETNKKISDLELKNIITDYESFF